MQARITQVFCSKWRGLYRAYKVLKLQQGKDSVARMAPKLMSNHTTGTDMADTSPDSPLQPSNPPQELMHILEELWFEGYSQHNAYGLADSKQRTMHVEKALAALQAYINKVIGEDETEYRPYLVVSKKLSLEENQSQARLVATCVNHLRREQRKRAGL